MDWYSLIMTYPTVHNKVITWFTCLVTICKTPTSHLSLNQGWTFFKEHYTQPLETAEQVNNYWRQHLTINDDRITTNDINLVKEKRDRDARLGNEICNIASIHYEKDHLPDNQQMIADLKNMLSLFAELKQHMHNTDLEASINAIVND